ncbi:Protein of unknown function [Bacillus cereus]|nr:Protein of unknown function [Bacillus cereus]
MMNKLEIILKRSATIE